MTFSFEKENKEKILISLKKTFSSFFLITSKIFFGPFLVVWEAIRFYEKTQAKF